MSLLKKKLRNSCKEFPIELYDSNSNPIYYENSNGFWDRYEYDSNNNETYFENSRGYCSKRQYDSNNNEIYYENSDGSWIKREYDNNNNLIYYENSKGEITDKRPKKELTIKELEEMLGIKNIKIIKE